LDVCAEVTLFCIPLAIAAKQKTRIFADPFCAKLLELQSNAEATKNASPFEEDI
jgi:hypothetical protein